MIITNGTRVAYWDKKLVAAPVFDTLTGKVVAVTKSWEQAQEIVEKGLQTVVRSAAVKSPPFPSTLPSDRHTENEYRRKAGMKFPGTFIF